MRLKHGLAAGTAALFLIAGGLAQAQTSTSPSPGKDSGMSSPSRSAPPAGMGSSTGSGSSALDRSMLQEVKDDDKAMATGLNVSAKDLADMDIYGTDGKKIGEVEKVLADKSNAIKAVTVDVGGFLGMGAREVIIPIDQLQKGQEKDRLQTSMTKAELEKLDEWSDSDRGSARERSGTGTAPGTSTPSRSAPTTPPSR